MSRLCSQANKSRIMKFSSHFITVRFAQALFLHSKSPELERFFLSSLSSTSGLLKWRSELCVVTARNELMLGHTLKLCSDTTAHCPYIPWLFTCFRRRSTNTLFLHLSFNALETEVLHLMNPYLMNQLTNWVAVPTWEFYWFHGTWNKSQFVGILGHILITQPTKAQLLFIHWSSLKLRSITKSHIVLYHELKMQFTVVKLKFHCCFSEL